MHSFPLPKEEIASLQKSIGVQASQSRAFVLGHGLWSDLDVQTSLKWVDTVMTLIKAGLADGTREPQSPKALLVTPNAAGKQKPDMFLVKQGNKVRSSLHPLVSCSSFKIDFLTKTIGSHAVRRKHEKARWFP